MKAISNEKAMELIGNQLEAISVMRKLSADSMDFKTWKQTTGLYVEKIFGSDSKNSKSFEDLTFWPLGSYNIKEENYVNRRSFDDGLNEAEALLRRFIQELEHFAESEIPAESSSVIKQTPLSAGRKIFVVHGHDEKLKTQVARFLEQLNFQPIILHEQADQGQTIIEKFEKHSDVSFAVVLLTPDDEGRKAGDDGTPRLSSIIKFDYPFPMKPRARQNVIFEFGYFIGKLGRANVCGLYCEGVELPSDYSGVLYTKVDVEGVWQFKLCKELKAAGFAVDANRIG